MKIRQQFIKHSFFFHFEIFVRTILRVTQLGIDSNNVNTYYYENTIKRRQSATFHSQKIYKRRERAICSSILPNYLFYITNLNHVQFHRQYLRLDFENEACYCFHR